MSCHTWAYRKLSVISEEEKEKRVNGRIKKLENWWGFQEDFEQVVKTVSKWGKDGLEGKTPEEYATEMIQEYKGKLEVIKNNGWTAYIQDTLESYSCDIEERNGELYYLIGSDIPFRVYGYPEETFTDKETLINWLKENSDNVVYYIGNERQEGFSDELVRQIDTFYAKYGENDLYFEFG